MRKVRDILRLAEGQGMSIRQMAASLEIPVMTVSDQLRRAGQAGLGWPLPEGIATPSSKSGSSRRPPPPTERRPLPDWNYVHTELRRPGVTLMLLWLEYKEAHPDDGYGYSQFCLHYRAWQRHVDVVMRQEHRAGEKLFVDFPGQHLAIYDRRTGEVAMAAELFVAVMGASNYLFAEAVASQDCRLVDHCHVHAFEAWAACRDRGSRQPGLRGQQGHRYEPDINASYQEMAAHYGGHHPRPGPKAPGQGQGRGGSALGGAMDPRPAT